MGGAAGGKDYYGILGAGDDASGEELGRRYKRLAAERHPDRGGSDDEMRDLNEAYRVLRDPSARKTYDESRREAGARHAGGAGADDAEGADEEADAEPRVAYVPRRQPAPSPAAQADAVWGRAAGAALAVFSGLVLLVLVRVHYVVFLWPLALLAAALVFFGVWMAHAAMAFARAGFAPSHPARRTAWAQELVFWSAVAGGGCGLYLLLAAV
jgi:hypothetical protein